MSTAENKIEGQQPQSLHASRNLSNQNLFIEGEPEGAQYNAQQITINGHPASAQQLDQIIAIMESQARNAELQSRIIAKLIGLKPDEE